MQPNKLVVMIPAYNEESTIGSVIRSIPKKIANAGEVKVLVIDDGSRDRTVEEAKRAGADRIVSFPMNRGLGVAFKTGIEEALKIGAEVIVNIDADGQFDSKDIAKLAQPILKGEADVVTCSRFKDRALEPKMPFVKKFGNSLFTAIINFLTGQGFSDTQCGFRAYSREAALHMTLFGKFTYTQEVFLNLVQKGFTIKEVACNVKGERIGKSKIVKHWYSYGVKALMIIIRTVRDYRPLQFFGSIGLALFLIGSVSALVLFIRLLLFKVVSPYMWAVYADVILIVLGFLLMILALLADMSDRQRKIQEEILYRLKKFELAD